jgi:ankyrin repeat protein
LSGELTRLDAGKWTGLLSAARGGKPEILDAMSRLGDGAAPEVLGNWKQFLNAASSGNAASVASLMQQPALAGLLGKAGGGLQAAANELPGNAPRAIITALIDNGANIAAANRDGQTPAALALKSGQKILAEMLGAPETGPNTSAKEDAE